MTDDDSSPSAGLCNLLQDYFKKRNNNSNNTYKKMFFYINRKICNFCHLSSGLGKKIKLNFGLFECQFNEIAVNANTVGDGPANINILYIMVLDHSLVKGYVPLFICLLFPLKMLHNEPFYYKHDIYYVL